jgi:hypothetical protein
MARYPSVAARIYVDTMPSLRMAPRQASTSQLAERGGFDDKVVD